MRILSITFSRLVAVTLFAVTSSSLLNAQRTIKVADLHQPALFNLGSVASLNFAENTGIGFSSSVGSDSAVSVESLSFLGNSEAQPSSRRRYGRPNHSGRMQNPDGSSKIAFLAGAGFTSSVNKSTNYLKPSWKFQTGIGYNFNKKMGVVMQFDWDNFGLPSSVITNEYNLLSDYFNHYLGVAAGLRGLNGNTHIWSFSLNPTYNIYQSDTTGFYAVVGGGFYHKVTVFFLPGPGQYCNSSNCYTYQGNQTFDYYTSNSAGVSGGLGFTWKLSRLASQKLYAEARYVHTFDKYRPQSYATKNLYAGNSQESRYVPVTIGLRF